MRGDAERVVLLVMVRRGVVKELTTLQARTLGYLCLA
jgi:hypothetical protein